MRLHRLFCPTLSEGRVTLPAGESRHGIVALRLTPGQKVVVFDGAGREGVGTVAGIDARRSRSPGHRHLHIDLPAVRQRPFELLHRITLAAAVAKPHRQGFLIEKCTELGVARIWPVITERSVSRPGACAVERWSRRAVEACKQCGRAWVPTIAAPQSLAESISRIGEFDAAAVTDPNPSLTRFGDFLAGGIEGASVLVWVGPEGGWSETERRQVVEAGAVATTLGPTVLRSETAAVAVCAAAAMYTAGKRGTTPRGLAGHADDA